MHSHLFNSYSTYSWHFTLITHISYSLQLAVCVVFTLCLTSAAHQASISSNETNVDWKIHKCVKENGTAARKRLRLNREIFSIPKVASPTHTRVIRLYCRTGYLMEASNKRLQGTTDIKSNQSKIHSVIVLSA